jgi:transglutaminase-like putative cysteine protease
MFYSIRHVTRFRYSAAVSESVMEVRVQPRSEGPQRLLSFDLGLSPTAKILAYRDFTGNVVHHFNLPGHHQELAITSTAVVEMEEGITIPAALAPDAWQELAGVVEAGDYWEMLLPSQFCQRTARLQELANELGLQRGDDPMSFLRSLTAALYDKFEYVPKSTRVDSPIDEALASGQGVCQDFAHIMIALVREFGIPCRYVSGYLYHRSEDADRSAAGATHAWVEALLPVLGWVGFDPTNNLLAGERHIKVAIGRDYADVPPTRGVFKGDAGSELSVSVMVAPADAPTPEEIIPAYTTWLPMESREALAEVQQQQ